MTKGFVEVNILTYCFAHSMYIRFPYMFVNTQNGKYDRHRGTVDIALTSKNKKLIF